MAGEMSPPSKRLTDRPAGSLAAVGRWVARQWTSIVLIGTGWALMGGAVRFDQASDELAGGAFGLGTLLVIIGALHHRGLSAGGPGVTASVPPDPAGEATRRLAELEGAPSVEDIGADDTDDAALLYVAERMLELEVLRPGPPLADCRGQVWLFDPQRQLLYPILEPSHVGLVEFAVGQGAVGRAWRDGGYVTAVGESVRDDTFDLNDEQQERYADLAAAAAIRVENEAGAPIAVLSMSTRDPASRLGEEEGVERLIFLRDVVARVLVDLLKWFSDTLSEPKED